MSTPSNATSLAPSFNQAYVGARSDVVKLIPTAPKQVLDLGCATGSLGLAIKQVYPGARVVGVELMEEMAAVARTHLDEVHVGDIEAGGLLDRLPQGTFDLIICADVLEHLRDPWETLRKLKKLLTPEGRLIASLPNVRHLDTLFHLVVLGNWPHRDRGIHDRTHLRFFTRRTMKKLFEDSGFAIDKIETNYRIIERPHPLNSIARFLALPGIAGFLAFQYLVVVRPAGAPKSR